MKPDRWQEIDRVFESVLAMPPEERAARLDELCADDADMRREVEELLDAERASASFLSTSLGDVAVADALGADATYEAGHRIGPYELLRPVGQGGMSTVYLATRADGHYQRTVAIKLIRRGFESAQILHRFRMERQILAGLEHPSIARLYDGGTTEDGFPFLVMEYIEGLPLDRFCDEHERSIDERLALFRDVCLAVDHAHRNLLVHRDLKPSNILVTEAGEVKLLDFGIAKLLAEQAPSVGEASPHGAAATGRPATGDPGITALGAIDARDLVAAETQPGPAMRDSRQAADAAWLEVAADTATGVRPMTPGYASPEQVRGETVTPASDLYALGVVLYQLLAGVSPYGVGTRSQQDLEQAIVEERVPAPSESLDGGDAAEARAVAAARGSKPGTLRKRLHGELDAITLKALEKDPADRYSSALALADDLAHHRDRKPVSAVPSTAGYRFRRFVQRNALAVSAGTVVVSLLVALTAVTLLQAARVTRERNLAQAERERAQEERERAQGVSDFLLGIFAKADPDASRGEDLTVRAVLDESSESLADLADQPERQALYSFTIAGIYRSLGELSRALELYEQAAELRLELFGEDHMDVAEVFDELAVTHQRQGNYDAAEPPMRRAFAIRERLLGRDNNELLPSLNNLGLLLYRMGNYEQANILLEETARRVEEGEGFYATPTAITRSNYALSLHETGDYEAAEKLYREALAINIELHGEEHSHVSISLHNLASLLADNGQLEEAEDAARRALAMRQKLLGEEHPRIVATMTGLAEILFQQERHEEARPLFVRAVDIGRKALGDENWRVGNALTGWARLLLATDETEAAVPMLEEALAIYRAKLPEGHIRTAYAEAVLGGCLSELARTEEAEPLLLRAYPALRDRLTDREPMTRDARALLVAHFERTGQPERATPYRAP